MPVNMDPSKKRFKKGTEAPPSQAATPEQPPPPAPGAQPQSQSRPRSENLDTVTDRDKELALADAEWRNLWDATEVIDMDKW